MENSDAYRLIIFVTVLVVCAVWEYRAPRKARTRTRQLRWSNNLGLVGLNSVLLAAVMPVLAIDAAYIAQQHQIGLFNQFQLSAWLLVPLGVVLLDAVIYFQHLLFHRIPLLWRLHRMHHSDRDIDVTTGARFHPIEILLSMLIKIAVITALGLPPLTVLLFEIILNASAMFNHSNGFLPLSLDKKLRRLIVTPDFHRVHHSILVEETHSNFGFFLSVWDIRFGTYREQPAQGHDDVEIGIPQFSNPSEQRLDKMLTQPFRE
ncbi:sterol desaturase [Vibrio sp. 10N.286.49.C2]|uniref:sterol desaturase family protein n=1 Tax=unclassified Vibrio TaxID=2614977 RepID=UPI000C853D07|nr:MULTISPECIES: sterol desaturase family protein [unclassified Vibrio]PMH37239.1 sterol desaturase [Vibrio sp. 10N.286.49.C2]PMH57384.1 sterol desaturase [Vibrio sp. 10N.286.49.B1]